MTYSFQPATIEDAPAIAEIFQIAFENDHIVGHFYPDTPKQTRMELDTKLFSRAIEREPVYGERYTKVIDESSGGKTVGFAGWQYPCHLTPEQQADKDKQIEESRKERQPPGAQVALLDEFYGKVYAGRKKWIDPKTFCTYILPLRPIKLQNYEFAEQCCTL